MGFWNITNIFCRETFFTRAKSNHARSSCDFKCGSCSLIGEELTWHVTKWKQSELGSSPDGNRQPTGLKCRRSCLIYVRVTNWVVTLAVSWLIDQLVDIVAGSFSNDRSIDWVVNSINVATLALLAIFTNYITIMAAPAGNANPAVVEGNLGGLLVPAVPDPFPIANYPRAPVSAARERIHYSAALKDDDYEYRCVSPVDWLIDYQRR